MTPEEVKFLNENWTTLMVALFLALFVFVLVVGAFVRGMTDLHERTHAPNVPEQFVSIPDPDGWDKWVKRTGLNYIPDTVSMADYENMVK